MKLGFEDEYEELEADLQDFSEKFADSPAAQVGPVGRSPYSSWPVSFFRFCAVIIMCVWLNTCKAAIRHATYCVRRR